MKDYILVTPHEDARALIPVHNIDYIGYDMEKGKVRIYLKGENYRSFCITESIHEFDQLLSEATNIKEYILFTLNESEKVRIPVCNIAYVEAYVEAYGGLFNTQICLRGGGRQYPFAVIASIEEVERLLLEATRGE